MTRKDGCATTVGRSVGVSPPKKRARGHSDVVEVEPEKSPNDTLSYRLLVFNSGFEALLVASEDNNKNNAAAAVAVGVGSFSDPQGRCEGLAHYLEHMLFMGSAKYPREDEMEEFLAKHGGYSNAVTESAHTRYYFEVNKAQLHTALDMFAQFFINPLLKTESADREVNAIESEFRLTQNTDESRVAQVFASFAKEGHPFRTFGWGNLKSLRHATQESGVDINAELRAFYASHYKAPRIRLCVFGVESLNSLQESVLNSFGDMLTASDAPHCAPSLQEELFARVGMPFPSGALPKLLRVRPVKDTHELSISWQLPPTQHLYKSKPIRYLQHLVGHEGHGSLLSWLKRQGLATELVAGVGDDDFECNTMCSIFRVDITLTVNGVSMWPQVAHAVFLYLDMLRLRGPQLWVFEELQKVCAMEWRFMEEHNPTDYVQHLSSQMLPDLAVERSHMVRAPYMMPDWDPEVIITLLDGMLPDRCMIDVLSSAYGRSKGAKEEVSAAVLEVSGEEEDSAEEDAEEAKEGDNDDNDIAGETECAAADAGQGSSAKDPHFDLESVGPPSVEPHFGTEYWEASQEEVGRLITDWKACPPPTSSLAADAKDALRLPDRNRFLATDFELKPTPACEDAGPPPAIAAAADDPTKLRGVHASFPPLPLPLPSRPRLVPSTEAARAWHLQDTVFLTPRSEVWLKLSSDEAPIDPHSASTNAHLSLLTRVLSDSLNEMVYLAEKAALHLAISHQFYGLDVCVGGWNHKLSLLLDDGIKEVMSFGDAAAWERRFHDNTFTARLEAQRQQLLRESRNAYLRPGEHVSDLRRLLLMPHKRPAPERARALEVTSGKTLAAFGRALVPKLRAELLVSGNVTVEESLELLRGLPSELKASGAATDARPKHPVLSVLVVPKGDATVWVEDSPDVGNSNVAVELYWQLGPTKGDTRLRVVLDLLASMMAEPLFDTLRTKQQVGYVAGCGARNTHNVSGFSVWVMSAKVAPAEICRRVEDFLRDFRQKVVDWPEEDFERHVSSLAARKLEPDRTVLQVQQGAWAELQEQQYDFDRLIWEALALAALTRVDVLQVWDKFIASTAIERRLIICAVLGGRAKISRASQLEEFRKDYPSCIVVSSLAEFHRGAEFFNNLV